MQQALHMLTSPQTGVKCSEQLTDRIKDNTFLSCGWRKHRPALTSQPHPSVDEPESDGDGVQDHLSLCSLFVLFLQMLESPVQLDELLPNQKKMFYQSGLLHHTRQNSFIYHELTCRRSVVASTTVMSSAVPSREGSYVDSASLKKKMASLRITK